MDTKGHFSLVGIQVFACCNVKHTSSYSLVTTTTTTTTAGRSFAVTSFFAVARKFFCCDQKVCLLWPESFCCGQKCLLWPEISTGSKNTNEILRYNCKGRRTARRKTTARERRACEEKMFAFSFLEVPIRMSCPPTYGGWTYGLAPPKN